MVEIREAKLEDSEQIARLYGDVYEGKYSLHEFLNPSSIEEMLKEGHLWLLVCDEGKIVGSAVGTPNNWNNSIEYGRGVLRQKHRNKHIGKKVSKQFADTALENGFDIIWGGPRNIQVYFFCESIDMVLAGYFPGAHKVDSRETHLFSVLLSENAREKRVVPFGFEQNEIYSIPAVKRIIKELNLRNAEGAYPDDFIVGPKSGNSANINYDYRHGDEAFIINSIDDKTPYCGYIEVNVPTANLDAIGLFKRLNFEICTFLPAWYGDDKRYDCVKMANYEGKPEVVDKAMESIVKGIYEEFGNSL